MINPYERWPATLKSLDGFCHDKIPGVEGHLSYSQINILRTSPAHYDWRYNKGHKPESTPDMEEGRAIHKALLETDLFLKRMKVRPSRDGLAVTVADLQAMAKKHEVQFKAAWKKPVLLDAILKAKPKLRSTIYDCVLEDFEQGLDKNDVVFGGDQGDHMLHIIQCVSQHEKAMKLLSDGTPELCAYWYDKEFDVLWFVKLDYIRFGKQYAWVTDVKSTRCAEPKFFRTETYKRGYYLQDWIYKRVVQGITGMETKIEQVVVEKRPPYICEVYPISQLTYETAYWEIGRLIEKLKRCRSTGTWPGYTDGRITPIELPRWATYEIEERADKELET